MNNTQPSKPDPKGKAIASFWLGIIAIATITPLGIYLFLMLSGLAGNPMSTSQDIGTSLGNIAYGLAILGMPLAFLSLLLALVGLILGIWGLKSTRKGLAKKGILLSLIVLVIAFLATFSLGLRIF